MRNVLFTALAGFIWGAIFGFSAWTEPMGGGLGPVATTVVSALAGGLLSAALGITAYVIQAVVDTRWPRKT